MKNLIIFGAGDLGKFLAYNIDMFDRKYNLLGFIDGDANKVGHQLCGLPVFGTDYLESNKTAGLCMAIAINSPVIKEGIFNQLKDYAIEFPNFISPHSWLSRNVKLGCGILMYPNSTVDYESQIGDFVTINAGCSIGHNNTVGRFSSLAPGVNLAGFTTLEEKVSLGIGCCTKQKITIGHSSIIGGQAMIIKDIAPASTAVGVPCKVIK